MKPATLRMRKWREKNPEKALENNRKWRENNPEKAAAKYMKWLNNNREAEAARNKASYPEYYKKNAERIKSRSRLSPAWRIARVVRR